LQFIQGLTVICDIKTTTMKISTLLFILIGLALGFLSGITEAIAVQTPEIQASLPS